MEHYKYKPWRFYFYVFAFTWLFWIIAALVGRSEDQSNLALGFMLLGLLVPALTAPIMVFTSGNMLLKADFKRKLTGFYRLNIKNLFSAFAVFAGVVVISIGISLLFGGSPKQFGLTEGSSFSIYGASALITILLASIIEEVGWRGYGEDAVGYYHSWFWESIIFGTVWSLWHLPLFFIPGSYHHGLVALGPIHVANFLISVVPFGFIVTWVYLGNNRSMLASILFHIFVNFLQENIAMTPETKCIQSLVIFAVAILIVALNRNMFFDRSHIGRLLENDGRLRS
ncbi:MAG TPA: CPBP family intramembrane metalloprotease [Natronincola sp.]|nr:CPBP family intramembrane metalloprotease [Natronincola sp.]